MAAPDRSSLRRDTLSVGTVLTALILLGVAAGAAHLAVLRVRRPEAVGAMGAAFGDAPPDGGDVPRVGQHTGPGGTTTASGRS